MNFPKSDKYTIIEQNNEADFLENRKLGLGGSDASAILGYNPWMSNTKLFDLKTEAIENDFKMNEAVEFGNNMESYLHDIFYLQYPTMKQFDTKKISLVSNVKPFMKANLDGFMQDDNGRYGILEIKTVQSKFNTWYKGEIPMYYLCQLMHYMFVTNADFAIMYAFLNAPYSDNAATIKRFIFERSDYQESIDYLVEKETNFWENNILKNVRPSLTVEI